MNTGIISDLNVELKKYAKGRNLSKKEKETFNEILENLQIVERDVKEYERNELVKILNLSESLSNDRVTEAIFMLIRSIECEKESIHEIIVDLNKIL